MLSFIARHVVRPSHTVRPCMYVHLHDSQEIQSAYTQGTKLNIILRNLRFSQRCCCIPGCYAAFVYRRYEKLLCLQPQCVVWVCYMCKDERGGAVLGIGHLPMRLPCLDCLAQNELRPTETPVNQMIWIMLMSIEWKLHLARNSDYVISFLRNLILQNIIK